MATTKATQRRAWTGRCPWCGWRASAMPADATCPRCRWDLTIPRVKRENGLQAAVAPAPAGFTYCSLCHAFQHPRWHQPEWRNAPERTRAERDSYTLAPVET